MAMISGKLTTPRNAHRVVSTNRATHNNLLFRTLSVLVLLCALCACLPTSSGTNVESGDINDFYGTSQSEAIQKADSLEGAARKSRLDSKQLKLIDKFGSDVYFPAIDWLSVKAAARARSSQESASRNSTLKLVTPLYDTGHALSVDDSGVVSLWDVPKNQSYFICEIAQDYRAIAVDLLRGLVALARNGFLEIYSLEDCSRKITLDRIKTRISQLSFHPSGLSVLAAGLDGKVYHWRFAYQRKSSNVREKQRALERYFGHAAAVSSATFHPEGRVFFSADLDGAIYAWLSYSADQHGGKYDASNFGFRGLSEKAQRAVGSTSVADRVEDLQVSSDGNYLLVTTQSGWVEVWKVRGFSREGLVQAHQGLIYDAALVSGSARLELFTVGRDGRVKLWKFLRDEKRDSNTLQLKKEFEIAKGRHLAGVSSDELVVATADGLLLQVQISQERTEFGGDGDDRS